MSLSGDMNMLAREIEAAAATRRAALGAIHEAAEGGRLAARQGMADIDAALGALRAGAATARRETMGMLAAQDAARRAAAGTMLAVRREATAALEAAATELRAATRRWLAETGAARAARARDLRQTLAEVRARLASEVAALHRDCRAQRAQTRAALHAAAEAVEEDLREGSEALRQQTAERLDRRRRVASKTLAAAAAEPEPTRHGGAEATAPHEAAPEVQVPEEGTAARDDLTRINGIGPAMQQRLYNIAITQFHQLAEADIDLVRERLGDVGRLADIRAWVSQARQLASATENQEQ